MPLYLYSLKITDLNEALLEKITPSLTFNIKNKISSYQFIEDRWRIILSDLLVRKITGKELNIDFDHIEIKTDNYGKPFIKNKERNFNLSYAKNIIVLATDDTPLGVDVEYIRPLNDLKELISHFSTEEQQVFWKINEKNQLKYFYELWTLKESYLKALGIGLSGSLSSFSINFSENEAYLSHGLDSDVRWYFKRYTFEAKYKVAICACHQQFPEDSINIHVHDLLNL